MSLKARYKVVIGVVAIAATGAGVAYAARELRPTEHLIPTARVVRQDLQVDVVTDGEFRAPKSATLVAPPVNGTLQIVHMLSTGAKVKSGDLVIEFDPSEQEYNYEQSESQLRQAEQDIIKAKADAEVVAAQDVTALLKARFDVRRAELDVKRNELLSEIDARKNDLALQEANRRLAQLEIDVKSRSASGLAGLKVLEEKRNAARLAMQVAQQNIDNMKIKAPMDGVVSAKENRDSTGGFYTSGMVLPEYRAGDLVFPGRLLAEVLDVSTMEVQARIGEMDRANVNPNQAVDVIVDAHPGRIYPAKVKSVAGMASRSMWSNTSQKRFDASFQLDDANADLRPGVSALVLIHGNRLSNVLNLPVQCLFEKDGKQLVYARQKNAFEPVEVKVKFRTESRVVVDGLSEGTEVALVDPTAADGKGKAAAKGGTSGGAMR